MPFVVINELQREVDLGRTVVVSPQVKAGGRMEARGTSTHSRTLVSHASLQPSVCQVCLCT